MLITKKIKIMLIIIAISMVEISYGQGAEHDEYTAIKAGLIIDGTGKKPISNGVILIKNSLIQKVGAAKQVTLPPHTKVINYSNKAIMPTLITAHAHLGIIKGTTASNTNNTQDNVLRQLKLYAQYGVGAVTSLGRDMQFIYQLRADRNSGKLGNQYAYIITAGQGLGVPNGAPPKMEGNDPVYRPTSELEINQDLDELVAKQPAVVKIWVDNFYGSLPKLKPSLYKIIIDESHKRGMRVAAHIFYLEDAENLVTDGVDILEHSVRDKPISDKLVQAMKQKNVAIIPTLQLDEAYFIYTENPTWMHSDFFKNSLEPGVWEVLTGKTKSPFYTPKMSEREALAIAMSNIKKLHDAGVAIGLGSDSGAKIERAQGFSEHRELQLLVDAGITPNDAIKIGTLNSAQIMHVDHDMGSIEPGKKANLLVLDANPLMDIKNTQAIYSVWLDGKALSQEKSQ